MANHERIVRIVQPSDRPYLPPVATTPLHWKNHSLHYIFQGLRLTAIGLIGLYLAVNFLNFGMSFNELLVIIGFPLAIGLLTSYATF